MASPGSFITQDLSAHMPLRHRIQRLFLWFLIAFAAESPMS
jgi:hypothetical protein